MTPDAFIELATTGDAAAAREAALRDPGLAAARNAAGVSVLCLAVYHGRRELAAALAALRSDLDIFEACCVGDQAGLERNLSRDPGAMNAISPDGFSPAGYSAFFGHAALLRALIERGADLRAASRNAMRVAPLHSAVANSDEALAIELARCVLDAGADPNAQQQGGFTALHEAARKGNLALIALLRERGADPQLASHAGQRPVDLARAQGHAAAVAALERQA